MSRTQLAEELRHTLEDLSDNGVEEELAGLLPPEELAGMAIRVRAALQEVASSLLQS